MATIDVTPEVEAEQKQRLEQKRQDALDSGASLEDVNTASRPLQSTEGVDFNVGGRLTDEAGAEASAQLSSAETHDMPPVESYTVPIGTAWPTEAANERASYIAMAAGGDYNTFTQVEQDLVARGASPIADVTQASINQEEAEAAVAAAAVTLNDPSVPDADKDIIVTQIQEQVSGVKNVDIADELTIRQSDNAIARAMSENDMVIGERSQPSLEERLTASAKIRGIIAEASGLAFNWDTKTALNLMGSFVSVNDMTSYTGLMEHLGKEWNAKDVLAPGEMMAEVREYSRGLSSTEQYDLALNLNEFLQANAGVLSTNDVQAVTMMSSIFNAHLGGDPDGFDYERWMMDIGPTLDIWTLGSFSVVRNAVTAPLRWARTSRLNRMVASDPDVAAKVVADAMEQPQTAARLGVTQDELIVKTTTPKPEGWSEVSNPAGVSKAVNRAEEGADIVKEVEQLESVVVRTRGVDDIRSAKADLDDTARGNSHWVGDSEIVGELGKPWKVTATIGKNDGFGFASLDEARTLLRDTYNGEGTIVTRSNRIDGVEEVIEKGQELKSATAQIVRELESVKATKLTKGQEKALRKELRELEAARKASAAKTPSVTTGGTKASRVKQAEAVRESNRVAEPLTREIEEIKFLLDQSSQGSRAEANISRLKAKQYDRIDGDVATRMAKLMEDRVIQTAKPASENVEYFLKVERKGDMKFLDDDVQVSLGAEKGSWVFDADTKFAKEISQMGNAVYDKWKFVEKEMLAYLDPIAKLSKKDQIAVSRLLAKANEEELVISARDLRNLDFTPSMSEAYLSFRKGMDVAYTLENRIFRSALESDGMMHVRTGSYNTFARPLSKSQASEAKHAFDPTTGTVKPIDVEEVYREGGQIARLRRTEIIGDQGTNFIVLRDTEVMELPGQVLRKVQGWLPQTNVSNYFVTRSRAINIDGVKQTRESTVGVAHSLTDAADRVKELSKTAEDGVTFGSKHDRALTADKDYAQHMHDLYTSTGGLFYSKRGDRMKDSGGMKSTIKDPLEAAVSGIGRVSRDSTMKPYIDDLKMRHIDTYGDLYRDKGRFPASVDDIHSVGQLADPRAVDAKAMYQHIDILDGQGTHPNFRKNSIIVADYAERNFGKAGAVIAKGVRSVADKDPVSYVRAKNFELNLATNPLAQLLVQPSQVLNMFALGATTFVTDFRRGRLVSKLAARKADVMLTDGELLASAKTLGMTVGELRADIKSFRRSGSAAAVTSHETARDAARPLSRDVSAGPVRRTVGSLTDTIYTKPVGILGKGFERGETINIGVHWQVAKRRWMKNNPGKSPYTPEAEFAIQGEARSLSLSMTRAGDFAYQRGIAALPTQYFAVQHKQLLLMTTSKALTRSEKFKVAGVQLAAWGPSGLGLGVVVSQAANEAGVNLSEGMANFLNDGLIEWNVNQMLSMAFDEKVELDLSARFAAASGLNDNIATAVLDMMLDGETADVWKIAFGPTASNANRLAEAAKTISTVYNTKEKSYEEVQVTRDAVLSVFSAYNNYTKAAVYRNMGLWTNSKGDILFEPNEAELIAKQWLGIQPSRVGEFYETKRLLTKRKEDIRDAAADYYKHLNAVTAEYLANRDGLEGEAFARQAAEYQEMVRLHNAVVMMHDGDAEAIMDQVQNMVDRNTEKTGFDELTRNLQKLHMQDGRSSSAEAIVNAGVSAGLLKEEEVNDMTNFVNHIIGEEEQ